jgi:glutaredoxin
MKYMARWALPMSVSLVALAASLPAHALYKVVGPDGKVTYTDRYPVTLYTTSECQPCDAARSMLRQRGIPHAERTVTTPQDAQAYAKLTGGNEMPMMQIGGQQVRGFSSAEWASYLDAAGYPKQSRLPSGYTYAPATPMVAVQAAPAAAPAPVAGTAPAPAPANAAPPPPGGNAPPGFKF